MKLRSMEEWINIWALPEMHAGVPEMGAVDAWHKALTEIEELKMDDTPFSGGVVDIANFFDQIRRTVVYLNGGLCWNVRSHLQGLHCMDGESPLVQLFSRRS